MLQIKALREAKGINMREASKQLGLPYTTYVSYEKGQREPTSEVLIKLADFFDTSVDYLVGRTSIYTHAKSPAVVCTPAVELTPDESDLLRKYRALDESAKGRIHNALDYEYNSIPGNNANPAPKEA